MPSKSSSQSPALLVVRPGRATDADHIIAGINEICDEGGAFYITKFQLSTQWQTILYQPEVVPDHLLLIALWNDQFAGSLRLFSGEMHTLHRHVADLGLFVLKPYRLLGIGTQLMKRALAWANDRHLEKITLSVFAINQPAIRFYRRFGFQQEGRLVRQIQSDQEYIDLLQLALFL